MWLYIIVYMKYFSVAEARAKFSQLIDSAQTTHQRSVIHKNGTPAAILLAIDDYEGMVDQIEILSDPQLVAELLAEPDQFKKHPEKYLTANQIREQLAKSKGAINAAESAETSPARYTKVRPATSKEK